MGVSLKTEQRRSHSTVSSFRPWVRRAEGYWGTRHLEPCMGVPVKPHRPPSLPLICLVFADYSSFYILRETPMAFFCDYFKKLNCYKHSYCRRNLCRKVFDLIASIFCWFSFIILSCSVISASDL
jgi:hypothetical protein